MHRARNAGSITVITVLLIVGLAAMTGCDYQPPTRPTTGSDGSLLTSAPVEGAVLDRAQAMDPKPGTRWDYTAIGSTGLSVTFPLEGPWNLVPDESVHATDYAQEVVAVKDAPEGKRFKDAAYAVRSTEETTGLELYVFRGISDDGYIGYGRAEKDLATGKWVATRYDPPTVTYPWGLKVGESRVIRESKDFTITATAVGASQARTPAGVFKRALLVRYDFTKPDGTSAGNSVFWILAPEVEWVAYIVPGKQLKPTDPISGITQIDILTTMPAVK